MSHGPKAQNNPSRPSQKGGREGPGWHTYAAVHAQLSQLLKYSSSLSQGHPSSTASPELATSQERHVRAPRTAHIRQKS